MEECFFGGWGWFWKGSLKVAASQRNRPHSRNSLPRQPAAQGHVAVEDACLSSRSFCAKLGSLFCTSFHNRLNAFSLHASLPPSNPLSRGNAPLTDLYQQPHPCSGSPLAFVLFHRPSAEPGWGICVCFPLQLCSPNVKLVYLWSWQSFSTLRMLLWMIITWVHAWGTTQCGRGQPQMVVPVEDINSGNVKTTLRQVKAGGAKYWESETERGTKIH